MAPTTEKTIDVRLNELEDKLRSSEFRNSEGLGNEVSFYIFDYDPADEYRVREYLNILMGRNVPNLKFVNIYSLIIDLLKNKGYLEKAFDFEKRKGTGFACTVVYRTLGISTAHDQLANAIKEIVEPGDILIITGVGEAYPIVRGHTILNNLLGKITQNPLVMFYPGRYTGQSLTLFNQINNDNYYRAFQIVGRK